MAISLERNIKQQAPEGSCESRKLNQCHVKNWMGFLKSIRHLSKLEQVKKVNLFANQHDYILDIENYGVETTGQLHGSFYTIMVIVKIMLLQKCFL